MFYFTCNHGLKELKDPFLRTRVAHSADRLKIYLAITVCVVCSFSAYIIIPANLHRHSCFDVSCFFDL